LCRFILGPSSFHQQEVELKHDEAKIDEMVLALLYLTSFDDGPEIRAWKAHDWSAMERLHQAGLISDPRGKAKSVSLTSDGAERAKALFEQHFLRES
jgi:hypothetical protein